MPTQTEDASNKSLRLSLKDYPLISPLLLCNVDQKQFNENKVLKNLIQSFITTHIQNGDLQNMSVYVIDYKNGTWTGVNENERYDPASMLKVPLMIAYYKSAENDASVLTQQVAYKGDDQNEGEYFKSKNNIQPNKFYTIDQLINSMIQNSDNTAAILLDQSIDKDSQMNVYTDLGLPLPKSEPSIEYLSAKSYAYFFRVLYNASYLDHKYSERALELLSKAKVSGIRDGVPVGTTVAQKFGERTVYNTDHVLIDQELHDCGIVYKPGSPYLLCIMSRGKDFERLAKNISELSSLVYQNIN